jgi:hypothetical protein
MLGTQTQTPKKFTHYISTYGLWLGTAVLAVVEIGLVRNLVLSLYAWVGTLKGQAIQVRGTYTGVALSQWATILMAIIAIGIIMGGFEYHHKRVGEPKSRRILLWTLGVQAIILLLGLLI